MERFGAFVFDHRRPVAAALAALAVLAALQSLRPDTDLAPSVVAARDLESGHIVTASDLTIAQVPAAALPDGSLDEDDAVGRRVAGPMRSGEPFTDRRVVTPREMGDQALSVVRVADPATLVGLKVGDVVDVVAAGSETGVERIVEGAFVATLPSASADRESASVGLETSADDALKLAEATLSSELSLVVTS